MNLVRRFVHHSLPSLLPVGRARLTVLLMPFVLVAILAVALAAQEKPPLGKADLEPYTRYFDVVDGKFKGEGAAFLEEELRRNRFVLLGEYHGSRRISEFTRAVIPVMHDAGCRRFALEIGPVSAEILSELSADPKATEARLNDFNTRFLVPTKTRNFTPIPFFSNIEDAAFLAAARDRGWRLIGLDQEFLFSYLPLFERMFLNVPAGRRKALKPAFELASEMVNRYYQEADRAGRNQSKAILESKEVGDFLDAAVRAAPKNARIAEAIRFTTGIYRLNADDVRKYFAANDGRVRYMKRNLNLAAFDPKSDRLLLKMGAVHTGRGFSDLSLFEIGNTLGELAALNDTGSLHVEFGSRFYMDGGKEIDALADPKSFDFRYQALLQMGTRERWTVIDLRPLRSGVFYSRKFALDEIVRNIFIRQDLFIIPPTETDPTPNYKTR